MVTNKKEASLAIQDSTPRGNEEKESSGLKGFDSELAFLVSVLRKIKASLK